MYRCGGGRTNGVFVAIVTTLLSEYQRYCFNIDAELKFSTGKRVGLTTRNLFCSGLHAEFDILNDYSLPINKSVYPIVGSPFFIVLSDVLGIFTYDSFYVFLTIVARPL